MESRASQFRVIDSQSGRGRNSNSPVNRFREPSEVRLFVHSPNGGNRRRSRALRIGRLILGGGEPQIELPLIDIGLKGTSITFPPGTTLAAGEVFEIVRPVMPGGGFWRPSGTLRKVVALVKIVGIEQHSRARVEVLGGTVRKGVWAERFDARRIAERLYGF